jgi:hypothetical protein
MKRNLLYHECHDVYKFGYRSLSSTLIEKKVDATERMVIDVLLASDHECRS